MIHRIDYIEQGEGAVIVRCYGEGSSAVLPERIGERTVTGIADHCFAPERSVRPGSARVRQAICLEEGASPQDPVTDNCEELCADRLREVVLPAGLELIGDYAFYACRHLEEVHVPASLRRLGGGSFVGANAVKRLHLTSEDGMPPECLRDLLGEIAYEVEAVVHPKEGDDYALLFPGFYEDSIENTPARIIEIHYEGMGYKYRQCFEKRRLSFTRYDDQFYETTAQELPETILHLLADRLGSPVHLSGPARQRYLKYLEDEPQRSAAWIFREDRIDLLRMLLEERTPSRELIEIYLDEAVRTRHTEAVSRLMEEQRRRFAPKKREYVF